MKKFISGIGSIYLLAKSAAPALAATSAPPARIEQLGDIFGNIVKSFLGFAGIVLFILLLVGGFKFITSGGDPKAVEGAQKTITYAIAGLIVILLSFLVLVLIGAITGVDVTKFNLIIKP